MLIAITADLHYGSRESGDKATRLLAESLAELKPDILIIAGDVAVADPRKLVECLELFNDIAHHRMVIPGNHDLWSTGRHGAADSYAIYQRLFTRSAEIAGFHRLDGMPLMLDGTAVVGSIGWYDYQFADDDADIAREYYERKILPGVGRWNDGRFIRWEHSDEDFLELTLQRLRDDLDTVRSSSDVKRILAITHHLPFQELVVRRKFAAWMFHNAYMGSPRIGDLLREQDMPLLAVSGHSHQRRSFPIDRQQGEPVLTAANVGSTYHVKRALVYRSADDGFTELDSIEVRK
jgi:Icc-related predicted phosphoesterase